MKYTRLLLFLGLAFSLLVSCSDDESFTLSTDRHLTFSIDTVKFDTVFSAVPTVTNSFWVYNRSGEGIRMSDIRLEKGNQTGYRVNVDGTYLGASQGYHTSNVELRDKDSIRVFVELTSPYNHSTSPQKVEDNLVFTLESGVQQRVNLNAFSWDAVQLRDVHISTDSTLTAGDTPIIIYGGITVDSAATLRIPAGTTLYFHADAGIDVYGRLISDGDPENEVVLRGDRIDHMFDYLPYDNVSGQWRGIHFYSSSYDNVLQYTDIHSTFDGIVIDSANVNRDKLILFASTVHNCQGYGVRSTNSRITLINSQITNTLNDCLCVDGGWAQVNGCTLAQFYPFDINRGVALRFFSTNHDLQLFHCLNSLVTGYSDIEMIGEQGDSAAIFNYAFSHCIIRDTTTIENVDTVYLFKNVSFEGADTTVVNGKKHFINIDTENLRYDFRLDSISPAIGYGDSKTIPQYDRVGRLRDEKPDIGAFEYYKE
ncbi:MAG: right-handed parallel beta-helix repeat-containing protein [Prevotella sp.]|nr:right-handed parallel beta-helix repeat-containing protein [Prevotella sp.]